MNKYTASALLAFYVTSYDSRHAVTYNVTSSFPKPVADVMKRCRDPELAVSKYMFFTIATAM